MCKTDLYTWQDVYNCLTTMNTLEIEEMKSFDYAQLQQLVQQLQMRRVSKYKELATASLFEQREMMDNMSHDQRCAHRIQEYIQGAAIESL